MSSLIKEVFNVLLTCSSSLACYRAKCVSLNEEPCRIIPTLIDLNPVELKYYSFLIVLDKFDESCNVLISKNMCS